MDSGSDLKCERAEMCISLVDRGIRKTFEYCNIMFCGIDSQKQCIDFN